MKSPKLLLFFAVLFLFFMNSCQDDTGLTDTNLIDAIVKTWKVDETGAGRRAYDAVITRNSAVSGQIYVSNFHNLGSSKKITATLSGTKITFSSQTISGYTLAGEANVSSDGTRIDWSYTVEDNIGSVNISAAYTPGSLSKKSLVLASSK
jgi:hypothetical protein